MSNAGLEADGLSFAAGSKVIIDGVSISVAPGETVALVGPSGCGKTTLLRLIAGLDRPSHGTVSFAGRDITRLAPHQRGFGMMFQDFALFPHLSVARNVGFGLRRSRLGGQAREARAAELLELAGLAGYGARTVEALSGGERQRVALARALAPSPRLLMLDEPLGSLDRGLRERLLLELKGILREVGIPAIYVTHDQYEAFAIADRVAIMRAGRIVRLGTPREVFEDPGTEFVARFLGLDNVIAGTSDGRGAMHTEAGRWVSVESPAGPVRLLLRDEGIAVTDTPGPGTVSGTLVAALFQGSETRVRLATAAGELQFRLPAETALPPEGSPLAVFVPNVQVLRPES